MKLAGQTLWTVQLVLLHDRPVQPTVGEFLSILVQDSSGAARRPISGRLWKWSRGELSGCDEAAASEAAALRPPLSAAWLLFPGFVAAKQPSLLRAPSSHRGRGSASDKCVLLKK